MLSEQRGDTRNLWGIFVDIIGKYLETAHSEALSLDTITIKWYMRMS